LIHDRDTVFSAEVDEARNRFGLRVLKTPVRSPMAHAHCKRVIGSLRHECLDESARPARISFPPTMRMRQRLSGPYETLPISFV
jgi:hypothetical protein